MSKLNIRLYLVVSGSDATPLIPFTVQVEKDGEWITISEVARADKAQEVIDLMVSTDGFVEAPSYFNYA